MPEPKATASLKEIYKLMVESLQAATPDIDENFMYYRTVNYHNWDDDDFLETMAQVIFASYLDWDVIEKKWRTIRQAFSCFDVDRVASYTDKDVKVLMRTSGVIKNKPKIEGIIENAKQMQEMIREYGSFANYVCFYPYDLKEDLLRKFYGLGATAQKRVVLDFMKEMGFPVIKDDEHIRRVLYRIDLTHPEDIEQDEILRIGKEIALAVGEKMPVVDCVLWSFGHYICKAEPLCKKCRLTNRCNFFSTK